MFSQLTTCSLRQIRSTNMFKRATLNEYEKLILRKMFELMMLKVSYRRDGISETMRKGRERGQGMKQNTVKNYHKFRSTKEHKTVHAESLQS